ncbi:MAG: 2-succinyl-5-enolpyruvyl-6-hydroxy-3-cyclohexene-1-carboxylic-acid synthase [Thermoanaerobaculia bacterium]|nr:2-succinyl-5-enolpyruvyl-6-hydroxy-3-cyclohexene-1-carboxylic-acid synthase [Thermoanaerobaculia bacterium]
MPISPTSLAAGWGRALVDELARAGLRDVVIAPGSRSTPLTLAFAAHPDVADHSVIDERSAAFVALGLARANGRPVAVVVTSGSAVGNLLPAVLEADRAAVPLLLLTADRPPELRDAGDSQATDQLKIFGTAVRWFHEAGAPHGEPGGLTALRSTAAHAYARAAGLGGPPGPVHLNLPYRKPLEPTGNESVDDSGRPGGAPWLRNRIARRIAAPEVVAELALALASARRPLVLAGADAGGEALRRAVSRITWHLGVPVVAEATSGLRYDPEHPVLAAFDLALASVVLRERLAEAPPDFVLRLGEAPLDWPLRRLATAWAKDSAVVQTAVAPHGRRPDPDHALTELIEADSALLLEAVADWLARHQPPVAADRAWVGALGTADAAARAALPRALASPPARFEAEAVAALAAVLPEDTALVVSSSLPIRDVERFLPTTSQAIDVFANRGLNGIDGVTSTAVGVALARRVPGFGSRTLLVIGDVAFAHDLSGALAAARLGADLAILVLDNGGGAIFDELPVAGLEPGFTKHFTTAPGLDVAALGRALGFGVAEPATVSELGSAVAAALVPAGSPRLVVWRVEREAARAARREVLAEIGDAVDQALDAFVPEPAAPSPVVERSPPLVLLHGFTGHAAGLADFRARLGDLETLAFDLPGHGEAPAAENLTFESAVAGVLRELDRRGLERVHLLGYSMGGRLALGVAVTAPERIVTLTLIGSSPGIPADALEERAVRSGSDGALAAALERDGLDAFVDRWLALPLFATQAQLGHRAGRRSRALRLASRAHGLARGLRALSRGIQPDYWPALATLSMPVLLIVGAEDAAHVGFARDMAARLPNARLEIVEGASHAPHVEEPERVAGWVREWVAGNGG